MLKPGGQIEGDEALEFYAKHTAQIEVGNPRAEQGGQPWGIIPAAARALPACGLLSLIQNMQRESFI